MSNLKISSEHHKLPEKNRQYAFLEAFANREITHIMMMETLCIAKRVCKEWCDIFNNHPTIIKIKSYEMLFTPMFERFVAAAGAIDTTTSQKYTTKICNIDNARKLLLDQSIEQEYYENTMLSEAIRKATQGYNILPKSVASNLVLPLADRQLLLFYVNVMLQTYYKNPLIPKILNVYSFAKTPVTAQQHAFATTTIGKLLHRVDKIENKPILIKAFNNLKELIIKHKLLPIEDGNLALRILNVPADNNYDPFPAYTVCGIMMFLLLINLIHMYFY